jgi:hypothetical protein
VRVFGKKQEVEVRINKNTLSVEGQIYQLRNLARVQCWKLTPRRAKIAYRLFRPAGGALALLVVLNFLLGAARGEMSAALRLFNVLAVLAIAGYTAYRFARDVLRRPEFVLLLETTGYPIGVLASADRAKIQNLVDEIADAIENPPESPRVFHIGDVVLGDQINQKGDNPIGKVLFDG